MEIKFGKVYKSELSRVSIIPITYSKRAGREYLDIKFKFNWDESSGRSYIDLYEFNNFTLDFKKVLDCKISRVLYKNREFEVNGKYLLIYKESFDEWIYYKRWTIIQRF